MTKIEKSLQRARNKDLGIDENEGKVHCSFTLLLSNFIYSRRLFCRNLQHSLSLTYPTTLSTKTISRRSDDND